MQHPWHMLSQYGQYVACDCRQSLLAELSLGSIEQAMIPSYRAVSFTEEHRNPFIARYDGKIVYREVLECASKCQHNVIHCLTMVTEHLGPSLIGPTCLQEAETSPCSV